ncbi:hypothetical protein WR25_08598 [Diploscapter pachys]|uniref:Uncharacterized protein n=1 Tax=Diploscapter pachys TaxID=2018661 RepID=A0A2A2KNJ6_9BILA|nr:hypothetical protein WR25_08598 [Diploscapter pachys]
MMIKSLVALATEKMLLKTSGKTFLKGIDFMYAAGLAPDRISVMMTQSGKYVLQFHSKCDIRPFAANYPSFSRVLRGIVHVRAWRLKSIEFVNVAFDIRDLENIERAIDKLGVELVLLRNCTYPHVRRGEEAIRFLNALNRKKNAVVCEYGDARLKHLISRRYCTAAGRTRRSIEERVAMGGALVGEGGNVDVAESAEDGEGVAGAGQQPPLPQMPLQQPQPAGVQPGEMDVNVGGQVNQPLNLNLVLPAPSHLQMPHNNNQHDHLNQ